MSTILVTGATDGIGRETARALHALGHDVIAHGRSERKLAALAKALPGVRTFVCDLASLEEVRVRTRELVEREPALDVALHNAGLFENEPNKSRDGIELTMAVNHFAPFLMTQLLLPRLRASRDGRVVMVSSMAHASGVVSEGDDTFLNGFSPYGAYAASKLANVLFARELARREPTLTAASLHPGVITTKLLRAGFDMAGAPVAEGAKTSVKVATEPSLRGPEHSGKYYSSEREAKPSARAQDDALAARFYDRSLRIVGL